jgi:hypothetical protein
MDMAYSDLIKIYGDMVWLANGTQDEVIPINVYPVSDRKVRTGIDTMVLPTSPLPAVIPAQIE